MAYNGEPYPTSPSYSQNPFEKYKTARTANLPPGIVGIGTGSTSRFQPRRKGSERKKIVRILAGAAVVGLIWWLWISHTLTGGEQSKAVHSGGNTYTPGSSGKATTGAGTTGGGGYQRPLKQQIGIEKASFVMLIRNSELTDALKSMKQIEDRFNRNFHYPWTFLNDVPFTEEFINATTNMASGPTEYGIIPVEHWSIPEAIDQEKMKANMEQYHKDQVIYGDSTSYRHMCRFNSGFFFRQKILAKYDWYWRVEPGIGFFCDVDYDPFTFMRTNNKKYGWVITLPEYESTIKTLWPETLSFLKSNPEYLAKNSSLQFLASDETLNQPVQETKYNMCHFWSNFEIADLNFWRGEAYTNYFEHLDKAGGFFYERWGDAPVHSIGAALFLDIDQVHHFADMGYKHNPWARCPQPDEFFKHAKCDCPFDREKSFDLDGWSCQPKWWAIAGKEYGAKTWRDITEDYARAAQQNARTG